MITEWIDAYIKFVRKTLSRKQVNKIEIVMTHFRAVIHDDDKTDPRQISVGWVRQYLAEIINNHGKAGALRAKDIMTAAWRWGSSNIDNFPRRDAPFSNIGQIFIKKPLEDFFSDQDIQKALRNAKGQSAVMLLTLLQTGASLNEVCRLSWKDICFRQKRIRFTRQDAYGAGRDNWLKIDTELVAALKWWRKRRPIRVPNVFMRTTDHTIQMLDPTTGKKRDVDMYSGAPIILQASDSSEQPYLFGGQTFASYACHHLGQYVYFVTSDGGRSARLKIGKIVGRKLVFVKKAVTQKMCNHRPLQI